jgi:hypothetical protein
METVNTAAPVVNELFLCPPKRCALEKPEIKGEIHLEAGFTRNGVSADKALGILDHRMKVFHLRGSYR